MFKILQADKDCYIQNKWIYSTRSINSNTGLASSLDFYYLYDETTILGLTGSALSQSLKEQTRSLIHFNLQPLQELTNSYVKFSDPSFKTYLSLKNVYGGQTTPSNFSIVVNPLAKNFDEGTGFDVVGYQDIDTANWVTASKIGTSVVTWSLQGANSSGSVGSPDIDYYTNFVTSASFARGDEDMYLDITPIVSATLAGILPDYGLRLAFTSSIEDGTETYFVKRFGSRHLRKEILRPSLVCLYDNSVFDNQLDLTFNRTNSIGIYNTLIGQQANFTSASQAITGSNSLILELVSSRFVSYATTSFSWTHSASITYNTRSLIYYSQSFSGSQLLIGGIPQVGQYTASVLLDYYSPALVAFHSNSLTEIEFDANWKSLDGTVSYSTGPKVTFKLQNGEVKNGGINNYVLTMLNFKQEYNIQQTPRFRVFIDDYSTVINKYSRTLEERKSAIYENLFYRLVDAYTRDVIVPFTTESNATRLSADGEGMYFDISMSELVVNKVYEFEFMLLDPNNTAYFKNLGYRFKVV
jgi:hypothetical protein